MHTRVHTHTYAGTNVGTHTLTRMHTHHIRTPHLHLLVHMLQLPTLVRRATYLTSTTAALAGMLLGLLRTTSIVTIAKGTIIYLQKRAPPARNWASLWSVCTIYLYNYREKCGPFRITAYGT